MSHDYLRKMKSGSQATFVDLSQEGNNIGASPTTSLIVVVTVDSLIKMPDRTRQQARLVP